MTTTIKTRLPKPPIFFFEQCQNLQSASMESSLSLTLQQSFLPKPPLQNPPNFNLTKSNLKQSPIKITASTTTTATHHRPITQTLKSTARAIIFSAAAAAAVISRFQHYPAIADPITRTVTTESELQEETLIPELVEIESNPEAITAMKTLLEQKLEAGETEESLKILTKLNSAQPENPNWRFLTARLLIEKGEINLAREAFFENPIFENSLSTEGFDSEQVINQLEQELVIAEEEKKLKEARDVRLMIALVKILNKNVDEALRMYDDLIAEDPDDFRPYFCKGMIYSLMGKDDEGKVEFDKYREVCGKGFEVEGFVQTPLLKVKVFGSGEED